MSPHHQNVLAYYLGLEWFLWIGQGIGLHKFHFDFIESMGLSVIIGWLWFKAASRLLTHAKGNAR